MPDLGIFRPLKILCSELGTRPKTKSNFLSLNYPPHCSLTMKKPTNHLASRTERLANYQLPFQKKLHQLQQLTDDVRSAWQNVLTEEVLASLQVIACESFILVVSTNSHTLANHLNYNQQHLLSTLQAFDNNFHQFNQLRFRVVIVKPFNGSQMPDLQCNQNVSNVKNCELSESTKRNITQLCDLVTDNEPLRAALQKLIKD